MGLTGTQVKAVLTTVGAAGGRKVDTFDNIAMHLNATMSDIGLRTAQGCATFLANVTQETAFFGTFTEFGGPKTYDPYRGRGAIQTTGKGNYRAIGSFLKKRGLVTDSDVFVRDPKSLASADFAWHTATEYYTRSRGGRAWQVGGLQYTSLAMLSDANASIGVIAKAINRGNPSATHDAFGIEDRRALWEAYKELGSALIPMRPMGLVGAPVAQPGAAPAKFDDGFLGPGTWTAFMRITRASQRRFAVQNLQRHLNMRGFTGIDGRPIVDDGEGLLDNTKGPTKGTHTQWALAKALGTTAGGGVFGSPSEVLARWQRQLKVGRTLPLPAATVAPARPRTVVLKPPRQTHGTTPVAGLQASFESWKFPGPGADVSLLEAFSRLVEFRLQATYGAYCLEDNVREKEDWHDNHVEKKTSAHQGMQKIWFVKTVDGRGLAMGADWNASKKEAEFMTVAAGLAAECGLRCHVEGDHLHVDTWSERIRTWTLPDKIGRPTNGLLAVDGSWGESTTRRLRYVLGMPASSSFDSDVVRTLQSRLNNVSHLDLPLSGAFDAATEAALGARLGTKTKSGDRLYVSLLQQSLNLQRI
ncbi:hypothetical protein [Luteipulveratus mongoliensis]|uniref:Uncharacterized protein n=1 Tax=Luteipulveratus mongoliensis TaxID=571913 RepID=A0A0K1JER9_9MICO|nr:hypothetical protein [Luteipulveratus mongoliensis]AKU15098.1 hypothetical protein VV02_03175 [Luteipulveratus mongoliensis]